MAQGPLAARWGDWTLDEPHAGLDQASRHEQALSQVGQAAKLARLLGAGIGRVEPIPRADCCRRARQVERAPRLGARDQCEGLVVMRVEPIAGRSRLEHPAQSIEQCSAAVHPIQSVDI